MFLSTFLFVFGTISQAEPENSSEDPHQWLETIDEKKVLDWVRERNQRSVADITKEEGFTDLQDRLQSIFDSKDRIPYVSKTGKFFYNFWKDGDHPRGLWRRTTMKSYQTDNPSWETIIDLDALATEEKENWVWHGANCLPPKQTRCIVSLSRGGADADVKREFDVQKKQFLTDGFSLPEAKSRVSWLDRNHLLVGTDFGEGSLTESGYPRITKIWKRGTPLSDAELLMEGSTTDMSVGAYHSHTPGHKRTLVYKTLTFYTNQLFLKTRKGLVQLDKQDSANMQLWKKHILLELREDWIVDGKTYTAGSLLAAPLKNWLKGKKDISVLFKPDEKTSLSYFSTTKDHIILSTLEDVKSKIWVATPHRKEWTRSEIAGIPQFGRISIYPVDATKSNDYWLRVQDYITPATLSIGSIGGKAPTKLKSLPPFFDANNLEVSQHFTESKDGTRIPYFQVSRKDISKDGNNPTLLYGYGGFEIALLPYYSASLGAAWLEKGGVYVVANIRGGGEYGPKWHQAALKEKRHKAYEDFAAVAENLFERNITSPSKIGIKGGSNGGLLMGNMYTTYPDHWRAIVCQVPLLDMKRYTKLLAGASWVGEYGDPDIPEQWEYLKKYSPYHNIDATKDYPTILITTSTRDDRVHPGHARKMAAALEVADKDVFYYENIEGGHGGSANNKQAAFMSSLAYTFLWKQLHTPRKEAPKEENPEEQRQETPPKKTE